MSEFIRSDLNPAYYEFFRYLQSCFPFFGVRLAKLVFSDCRSPLLLERTFADRRLVLDASRSLTEQLLFFQGEGLIAERDLVNDLLKPGMCVVDVGANIGYYTLLFHRAIGESGRIFCIEPSPENLAELRRNILVNRIENTIVHECAVGHQPGTVGIKNGLNSGVVSAGQGSFTTELHRLDDLVSTKVDFLKIDVDGFELHVLEGARGILQRDRPLVFLEFHPELVAQNGGSFAAVKQLLQEYYSQIEYFDVPEKQSIPQKLFRRYSKSGYVRKIHVDGVPESELHIGRTFGTFWMVCRA